MTPQWFERKSFRVQAFPVTAENMVEVADWCGGKVLDCPPKYKRPGRDKYIEVPVTTPPTVSFDESHSMALIGDWVLMGTFGPKGRSGYKVYRAKAFEHGFSEVRETEKPCGRVEQTADHQPCILGEGHLKVPRPVGCRSFLDYRLA